MHTSTTGKEHAFKHITYTLLILAYLQRHEQRHCDQTEESASSRLCLSVCMHVCARTCVCVKSEYKNHRNAKLANSESCWKCFTLKDKSWCVPYKKLSWLCNYFTQGAPFCVHLERYAIAFLTEFHVLVTGGWTNPQKIACNTQSWTHFEYCFYRTESAHTQLKGYETSWVKLSKLLTSPLIYEHWGCYTNILSCALS